MALFQKTYEQTRSLTAKITSAVLIVVGFVSILFMSSKNSPGNHSQVAGVAHADAVSCGSSCGSSCATGDSTSCGCGGGGGDSGCGK